MIFNTAYRKLCSMYNSFFRPPSVDLGFVRQERLSLCYMLSTFTLFIYSSWIVFGRLKDPEVAEMTTIKPSPETKRLKIQFDAKNFTFSAKSGLCKDFDKEENSS